MEEKNKKEEMDNGDIVNMVTSVEANIENAEAVLMDFDNIGSDIDTELVDIDNIEIEADAEVKLVDI